MEIYILAVKSGEEWRPFLSYFNSIMEVKRLIKRALERKNIKNPEKTLREAKRVQKSNFEDYYIDKYVFRISTLTKSKEPISPPGKLDESCCICDENVKEKDFLKCKHAVCENCITRLIKTKCPICREEIQIGGIVTKKILEIIKENQKEEEKRENEERMRTDRLLAESLQARERGNSVR